MCVPILLWQYDIPVVALLLLPKRNNAIVFALWPAQMGHAEVCVVLSARDHTPGADGALSARSDADEYRRRIVEEEVRRFRQRLRAKAEGQASPVYSPTTAHSPSRVNSFHGDGIDTRDSAHHRSRLSSMCDGIDVASVSSVLVGASDVDTSQADDVSNRDDHSQHKAVHVDERKMGSDSDVDRNSDAGTFSDSFEDDSDDDEASSSDDANSGPQPAFALKVRPFDDWWPVETMMPYVTVV